MKTGLFSLIFSLIIIPLFSNSQIHIEDSSIVKADTIHYAIAVTKNHTLVYEHYFNQKSAAELFNDQSLPKGIMSILKGIAIDCRKESDDFFIKRSSG